MPAALIAWHIASALALGIAVAGLYRWARRGDTVQPTFATTLVLLAAVIAMATQVIGDNVARAFSMVGALSVVRFRTVVKDTQDTAFVIFAVVVGMAAGANHLDVAVLGLGVVGVAAVGLWPPRRPATLDRASCTLTLRISPQDSIRLAVESMLSGVTGRTDLVSISTAKQGTAIDLVYRVRLRAGASVAGLVADLHQLDGVDSVELDRRD